MTLKRIIGSVTAVVALTAAVVLYTVHPVKSSDHQDTYNLGNAIGHNPSADITDVFVFPAPDNPNNVVFAMDTWPLIPVGMGTSKFFDPTILWQFKIAHGAATSPEDQVIQFTASGNMSASQQIAVYGPAKPNEVGTTNTPVAQTGLVTYDKPGTLTSNGSSIQVYAGPRADPFIFDLFAFFSFFGDRNFQTHSSQNDTPTLVPTGNGNTVGIAASASPPYDQTPDRPKAPSFNGFAAGTTAGAGSPLGNYACSTGAASGTLADIAGGFNVLSFVIEVPKSLLTTGFGSQTIHVWATASSNKTTS